MNIFNMVFFITWKFNMFHPIMAEEEIERKKNRRAGFENILMSCEKILKTRLIKLCLPVRERCLSAQEKKADLSVVGDRYLRDTTNLEFFHPVTQLVRGHVEDVGRPGNIAVCLLQGLFDDQFC